MRISLTQCLAIVSFVTIVLPSCTLQKRQHSAGFHIDWHQEAKNYHTFHSKIDSTKSIEAPQQNPQTELWADLEASLETGRPSLPLARPTINLNQSTTLDIEIEEEFLSETFLSDSCDNLVLRNGTEVAAQVSEITPTEIKYRRCDHLSGPIITISKNDVFIIQYRNGKSEQIGQVQNVAQTVQKPEDTSKLLNSTIPSMILGLLGFTIATIGMFVTPIGTGIAMIIIGMALGLFGLIVGAISVAKINKNRGKFRGKPMAVLGLIFSSIVLAGGAIVLAILKSNKNL